MFKSFCNSAKYFCFQKEIIWFRLHFHFSLSCIGEGNGNPLQCSCLENPRAAVCGVAQSQTRLKRLRSSSSSCHNCYLVARFSQAKLKVSQGKGPYYFHIHMWSIWHPTQHRVPGSHLILLKWAEKNESIVLHFNVIAHCMKIIALWWLC